MPFEAVAELLWTGDLPEATRPVWTVPAGALAVARAATATLPDTSPVAARLAVAVAAVAAADEARGDLRPDTVRRKARTMLTVFARTPLPVGTAADPVPARPVATELWPRLSAQRPTAARLRALDAALVLLADHELATSTLAARVAASTRANPFACVLAAIGAVSGPLHGRAAIGTHRVLAEALATGNPSGAVDGALESGETIPGLRPPSSTTAATRGPRCCSATSTPSPAPRSGAPSSRCGASPSTPPAPSPTSTSPSGRSPWPGSMPFGATEGIFTIGRTAGWVGHVLEEYEERPLRYRPRAIYTGP